MAGRVTKTKAVQKVARVAGPSSEDKVSAAIDHAIHKIQAKLSSDEVKPSVADLVRLLQLKKELDGERPKDVTVRWVDEQTKCKDNSANDE